MDYLKAKEYIIGKLSKELDPRLTYHSIFHSLDVLQASEYLATEEKIAERDKLLLFTAAVFHDSGMLRTYLGHEEASTHIVDEVLPLFGYDAEDIEIIKGMILATKLPQAANSDLQRIICDADLDYLGRNDFFMIAHQLKYEWEMMKFRKTTLREWYELQINFLGNHRYLTNTARRLREQKKQENLKQVQELVCFMRES